MTEGIITSHMTSYTDRLGLPSMPTRLVRCCECGTEREVTIPLVGEVMHIPTRSGRIFHCTGTAQQRKILKLLVECFPETCPRSLFKDRIFPGTRPTPAAISHAVRKVREVLDDTGWWIVTEQMAGFRLADLRKRYA